MEYDVEIGFGATIYIPSFIKIGSGIEEVITGDTQTHRQEGKRVSIY
jgi:hypothetical protein